MKAQTLIPIFFLMLFAGMQFEANAQASASVNYTIVVTEDMLAGDDEEFDRGLASNRFRDRISAASNVTAQMATVNDDDEKEFYTFETEIDSTESPNILSLLDHQISEINDSPVTALHTETITQDDGQYHVVLEYN